MNGTWSKTNCESTTIKHRIRNWLDSEHERIVSQAATIQSPSERQEYIAQAYAERARDKQEAPEEQSGTTS